MKDEKEILKRFRAGDPAASDRIFDDYYNKVYTFCLKNFRNKEDAEEAVQEVFFRLWRDREKLKDLKDIEGWIFSLCLNIIRNHFRRLAVEQKHLRNISEDFKGRNHSTLPDVEFHDLLHRAEGLLDNLPLRQRTIFLLSTREQLSNREIAKRLNISIRTVDNQLSRAKTYLRKALKGYLY
jgi:RNA polymerase sigma-70 factor (ECF subfamily)